MKADFEHYGLPTVLIVALLPFLAGFLTGVVVAFIGMCMPLTAVLMQGMDGGLWVAFSITYISGFLGVLFSPVHLCVILSAEKFGTDLRSIYAWMLLPGLL